MDTITVTGGLMPIKQPCAIRRPIPELPESCFVEEDDLEFNQSPHLHAVMGGAKVLGEERKSEK